VKPYIPAKASFVVARRQHFAWRSQISRLVLLAVLACSCLAFQATRDLRGGTIVYEAETRILSDPEHGIQMYSGPGTIVHFGDNGLPDFLSFEMKATKTVQGEYGIDATGRPKNRGRLLFRPANPDIAMPYVVNAAKDIYTYHLKYLELTTVQNGQVYRPYVTKAIAFDNKVEVSGKASTTYKMPEGRQVVIVNGKIKFGDTVVSHSKSYNLSGQIP
jgi:hypothetical protein